MTRTCRDCGATYEGSIRRNLCDKCRSVHVSRSRQNRQYSVNRALGLKWTVCRCPMCEKSHKKYLNYTGRGVPRVYCSRCEQIMERGERPYFTQYGISRSVKVG